MAIDIRSAKIDDLPNVFHLGEDLFTSQEYSNLYRTWDEFEVTGLFQSDPDLCLVAWDVDEQRLAGFLFSTTYQKAGSAWSYGHITWLGIDHAYNRKGIGRGLFDAIIKIMKKRGIRMLIVDTQADNEPAIAFFNRMGFSQATEHVYMSMNLENWNRIQQDDSAKKKRKQT
ncbi:MAG: GNAT family N-acetyltransferase [Chitinivibrionales bacterium]|nr:GNAT family N-acetyltransferase [Chitinivibrionales bacterium]